MLFNLVGLDASEELLNFRTRICSNESDFCETRIEPMNSSDASPVRPRVWLSSAAFKLTIVGSQLSNATTAVYASELSKNFGIELQQESGSGIRTRVRWTLMLEDWRAPLGTTSLVGSKQARNRFGADAEFGFPNSLSLGFSISQEERIVYRGRS